LESAAAGLRTLGLRVTPARMSASEIGKELRQARLKADLSLGDVSKATGLSSSFLSLVENGKSDISLGRLARLTDFLNVSLSDLIDPPRETRFQVMRRNERPSLSVEHGVSIELLPRTADHDRIVVTFGPGAMLDQKDYEWTKGGESFYFILEGELCIDLAGPDIIRLKTGDSIALFRQDFRRAWNVRDQITRVLIGVTFSETKTE
jgi:transcriptional regulator with XRE-family HTH domain